jgi:hypothetical protein
MKSWELESPPGTEMAVFGVSPLLEGIADFVLA